MAGLKSLFALAFSASIGLLFLLLGCALPQYHNWWPFFVIVFYILSPIPILIARRFSDDSGPNSCRELAYFITACIVLSAYALPIVLARAPTTLPVYWGACFLILTGNTLTFITILGFFIMADSDSVEYSMW